MILDGMVKTAAVYPFEYPSLTMSGPSILASMAASAMAEPDTPPINALRMTLTWARPPRMCPVNTEAKFISRWVSPVAFIRLAEKMSSGMANSGKFWVWEMASWTVKVNGSESAYCKKNAVPEIPMATAMGMPVMRKTTNKIKTSSTFTPFPAQPSRCCRATSCRVHGSNFIKGCPDVQRSGNGHEQTAQRNDRTVGLRRTAMRSAPAPQDRLPRRR